MRCTLWHVGSSVAARGLLSGLWHMSFVVVVPGLSCPVTFGILVPQSGIKPMFLVADF